MCVLTVPRRTCLPEAVVTGLQKRERGGSDTNFGQSILHLAVIAVLAVLIACSIVPGRPPCVPGRINPDNGRPDCDTGLYI